MGIGWNASGNIGQAPKLLELWRFRVASTIRHSAVGALRLLVTRIHVAGVGKVENVDDVAEW